MTTISTADFYGSDQDIRVAVPSATYTVVVSDARKALAKEGKKGIGNLFLSLEIQEGPQAGTVVDVLVNVPEPGGKSFHYRQKMAAFTGPELTAAIGALGATPTAEGVLDALVNVVKGKMAKAELKLITEGTYAGTNELVNTKRLEAAAIPAPVAAAPVAAPAPAAAPEVVLAVAEAQPAPALAVAPAPAENGAGAIDQSVPF